MDRLEVIFYWLNNTKGYIEKFELDTLCKLYLFTENSNYNINEINSAIESGNYEDFKKILGSEN